MAEGYKAWETKLPIINTATGRPSYGEQGVYSGSRTFGPPTVASGKFHKNVRDFTIPKHPKATIIDNTGEWWKEVDPGSGEYYRFGRKGGPMISIRSGDSSPDDPYVYTPSVYTPRSGTKSTPVFDKKLPIGPYPKPNVYFPMLVNNYTAPGARNLKDIMPENPVLGGKLTMGAPSRYDQAIFARIKTTGPEGKTKTVSTKDLGRPDYTNKRGLLYQPWTTQYQQAFVRPNIWNYTPIPLKVGFPQRYNPFGSLDLSYEPPPDTNESSESDSYPGEPPNK
jgi:hypothetical protein